MTTIPTPQDLMLRAETAYEDGHLEAMFEALEGAHAAGVRAGDHLAAAGAATRFAMHLIIDTGLLAPMRGWIKRAERLLEGAGTTPVHAWLGLARAYERLYSGDFAACHRFSEEAVEAGSKHGEVSAAAMARIADARAHIFEGNLETGLALLEEASVLATSGGLDTLTLGMTYCEIVCAWQGLAMYDVAEQWTDEMERFSDHHAIGSVKGRCRIHRAEILRLRGHCHDAETEALAACEELRPYMRREFGWPLTELGLIRLRIGDLDGAEEAFLAAHEKGWEPQPGFALLRLAQGEAAAASAMIKEALERPLGLPSKELPPNNDLRRAPLLDAQVEIAVTTGDLVCAREASEELGRIAEAFNSNALGAAAATAAGRVLLAEGRTSEAVASFRDAVQMWSEISAPYETAVARMGLADAYRQEGFDEGAELERRAAAAAFERVGAMDRASRASFLPGEPETAPRSKGSVEEHRFHRDGDFWTLSFDGKTTYVQDMKGLAYLQRLLSAPGQEVHALDLVACIRGHTAQTVLADVGELSYSAGGDAGAMLDERAKELYRRRLAEIDEDIEEARAFGNDERALRAEAEKDFLVRELSRAVGLGGRDRRAGATSERARAAVTRAIRNALKRIRDRHATLGEHLDRTVRTGTYCSYMPDPRATPDWETWT